ncbi:cupin domain-containing protein [bacterium]
MNKIENMKVVEKPWGQETWFVHNDKYLGKLISIKKDTRLSKQYHEQKQETFYSIKGRFILELNEELIEVHERQAITIMPGDVHRVIAKYCDVELIEISTPESEDIVRVEDDFGR